MRSQGKFTGVATFAQFLEKWREICLEGKKWEDIPNQLTQGESSWHIQVV